MRSNWYRSGRPGWRVLVALAAPLFVATAAATRAQVAGATRVIARGSLVSRAVSPADTSGLPAARLPAATELGALAAPVEAAPVLSPSDDAPAPATAATVDPSVQRAMGPDAMPAPLQNFEGMAGTALYPPDTDGQAGPRRPHVHRG